MANGRLSVFSDIPDLSDAAGKPNQGRLAIDFFSRSCLERQSGRTRRRRDDPLPRVRYRRLGYFDDGVGQNQDFYRAGPKMGRRPNPFVPRGLEIKELRARTIKPDGTIVDEVVLRCTDSNLHG
jgi:hypothetical protein